MNDPKTAKPERVGDEPPLVSIIVIGYNQQELAPLAVESVLAQTHERLECIFVDDGSEDETFERVQALTQADSRLRVFRKENGGPSSARNFGAARANLDAEFIAFLDGDDLYRSGYLSCALRYLRAHPRVGVVIPSHDFIDAAGAPLPLHRRGYRWVPSTFLLPRPLGASEPATPFVTFYCGTGVVPFWFARASDFRRTEGWDDGLWMWEDVDLLCQFALITEVHAISQRLVKYRIHPRQSTSGAGRGRRSFGGLSAVHEKWNSRHYAEREKERTLDLACLYYRQIHLPFRALRVARAATMEYLRSPSRKRLAWLAKLVGIFLRDFFYFKIFFWRSTRRYVVTRFYEAAV